MTAHLHIPRTLLFFITKAKTQTTLVKKILCSSGRGFYWFVWGFVFGSNSLGGEQEGGFVGLFGGFFEGASSFTWEYKRTQDSSANGHCLDSSTDRLFYRHFCFHTVAIK